MAPTSVGEHLAKAAGLTYGFFCLAITLCYAFTQTDFWSGESAERKALQDRASRNLWSLRDGQEGMRHKFLKLHNGTQLHYLLADGADRQSSTLVIFLHGFPDSAHLFSRQLRSSLCHKATLVALDLPGCGGSDGLDRYGPNEVLDVVAEAIVLLKDQYAARHDNLALGCILVGHDWGGVIGFRLAAETTGLIDHFIPINSLHPAFAESQLKGRVADARMSLGRWELGAAYSKLTPVLSQLMKSSYTYMLTLPLPLAKIIPSLTLTLVKFCHSLEYKQSPAHSPEELATRMAIATGPGPVESQGPAEDGSAYGPCVWERSRTAMPGDWDGRVKLYGHGLLRQKWTPNYPGHASPKEDSETLKCPVSFIFGMQDIALDPRIAVDGIERHFLHGDDGHGQDIAQQSRVVRLPDCGHWSLLEEDGRRALHEVLEQVLSRKHSHGKPSAP